MVHTHGEIRPLHRSIRQELCAWLPSTAATPNTVHHSLVLQAEGILVSPRIMADHMPDYVTETLQRMAREAALREDLRRTSNGAFVLDVPPSPQVCMGGCLPRAVCLGFWYR